MRSRRPRKALLLVPAAAALMLISACSATGINNAASQNGAADAGSGSSTLQEQPEFSNEPYLMLAATESKQVGWFVADAGGFPLYRYDKDTAKPVKSNCDAECVKLWPPVLVGDTNPMTTGVDPTLVGVVDRADGKKQLTLAGWPLYRYTGDKKIGDITGQGKGGTWFAVTPEGKKAQASNGAAPAQPSTGDGY